MANENGFQRREFYDPNNPQRTQVAVTPARAVQLKHAGWREKKQRSRKAASSAAIQSPAVKGKDKDGE